MLGKQVSLRIEYEMVGCRKQQQHFDFCWPRIKRMSDDLTRRSHAKNDTTHTFMMTHKTAGVKAWKRRDRRTTPLPDT